MNSSKLFCDDTILIGWVVPPPSKSHHQDYYIFSKESRTKPSFPLLLGGGTTQLIGFLRGGPFGKIRVHLREY